LLHVGAGRKGTAISAENRDVGVRIVIETPHGVDELRH
jgi:hypothetical protein